MLFGIENYAKKCALRVQYQKAQELLNFEGIFPYLYSKNMLNENETEKLLSVNYTRQQKIDLLVREILICKSDWWNNWLWCLHESSTEPGLSTHRTLAELLEAELVQQVEQYEVRNCISKLLYWLTEIKQLKITCSKKHIVIVLLLIMIGVLIMIYINQQRAKEGGKFHHVKTITCIYSIDPVPMLLPPRKHTSILSPLECYGLSDMVCCSRRSSTCFSCFRSLPLTRSTIASRMCLIVKPMPTEAFCFIKNHLCKEPLLGSYSQELYIKRATARKFITNHVYCNSWNCCGEYNIEDGLSDKELDCSNHTESEYVAIVHTFPYFTAEIYNCTQEFCS